jgi:hypothetical protein
MPRAVDAERHLAEAREALARNAFAIASREAWSAASAAARIGDEAALQEVVDIASTLLAAGGADDAEQLRVYAAACLEEAQHGTRRPSAFERLIQRERRRR